MKFKEYIEGLLSQSSVMKMAYDTKKDRSNDSLRNTELQAEAYLTVIESHSKEMTDLINSVKTYKNTVKKQVVKYISKIYLWIEYQKGKKINLGNHKFIPFNKILYRLESTRRGTMIISVKRRISKETLNLLNKWHRQDSRLPSFMEITVKEAERIMREI